MDGVTYLKSPFLVKTMKNPLVSIIVLTWNGKQYLKNCLDSCFSQTYDHIEVLLVDNASKDGTAEYVRKNYPKCKLILNKENLGFAEGNNEGIRNSRGDWVLILNNDTKLDKQCIQQLINSVSGEKMGMASPAMYYWGKEIDTRGLRLLKQGYTKDIKSIEEAKKVLAPCGGAAFYSKSMLENINLKRRNGKKDYFDPDFFIYAEDFDFGLRAQLAGWKCIHVPTAKVDHLHGATMNKYSNTQIFLGDRNRSWTIIKNYPSLIFWKKFPYFLAMNLASFIKWSFKGKPLPICKSKISILFGLPSLLKKRRRVQQLRKISNKEFADLLT